MRLLFAAGEVLLIALVVAALGMFCVGVATLVMHAWGLS